MNVEVTPRKALALTGATVLAGAALFCGGRFSAPVKVETHETTKTEFKDRIVTVEVEKKSIDSKKDQVRVIYRDRVIKPDGTRVEHTEARTLTEAEVRTEVAKSTEKHEDLSGKAESSKTSIVTVQPSWRVSLLGGGAIVKPWLNLTPGFPLVLGLEVDYRLFGGFSVGLWINTVGAAGLGLHYDF